MVVDRLDLAVAIPVDTLDGVRLAMHAAAGEGRVGRGHVERADAEPEAAYRRRRVGLDGRGDAKAFGGFDDVVEADVGGELDEDRVVRFRHGLGHGDGSPLHGVVVLYGVVLVLEAEVEVVGNVGGLRGDVFLQGGGEHEGLEGAARLAAGVERQVEVPLPSRQGPDGAALRLHGHDGGRRVGHSKSTSSDFSTAAFWSSGSTVV